MKAEPGDRARWRTRLARAVFPDLAWSGAGVIVRKRYFPGSTGKGWVHVPAPDAMSAPMFLSGPTKPRWVLVVRTPKGKEHVVSVTEREWHHHQIGDVITREHPLTDVG